MGRTCIFLAMLTVAQVKAVELAFYLKGYGAAQARTGMISHQNSFHGLWGRDVTRSFAACRSASAGASDNSDLLRRTRELNINLSATLERALKEELSKREAAQWVEENRAAIKSYNDFVEQHGCFGDEFREF